MILKEAIPQQKKIPELFNRTLDEIKKDGTINIGVFSDKNPFGYVMKTVNIRDMMYTSRTESVKISV